MAISWLTGKKGETRAEPPIEYQLGSLVAARTAADAYAWLETPRGALSIPAAWRAVTLTASVVASLPIQSIRGGQVVPEPPVIIERPNPLQPRGLFVQQTVLSLALWGNSYWLTHRAEKTGEVYALELLDPAQVSIEWVDTPHTARLYRVNGEEIARARLTHIPLMLLPGELYGLSPLQAAGRSLSAIAATDAYASQLLVTGAIPSGVIEAPAPMTPQEAEALKAQWMFAHSGSTEPAVLSGGIKYTPVSFKPDDLQLLEARDFSIGDIARLWGIPPHLLAWGPSSTSLTYSTTASLSADWLRFTLAPLYLEPIEAALSDLIPRGQSARFNTDELLRADLGARFSAYQVGLAAGFLTVPEVRALESLPPLTQPAPLPAPPIEEDVNEPA